MFHLGNETRNRHTREGSDPRDTVARDGQANATSAHQRAQDIARDPVDRCVHGERRLHVQAHSSQDQHGVGERRERSGEARDARESRRRSQARDRGSRGAHNEGAQEDAAQLAGHRGDQSAQGEVLAKSGRDQEAHREFDRARVSRTCRRRHVSFYEFLPLFGMFLVKTVFLLLLLSIFSILKENLHVCGLESNTLKQKQTKTESEK